MRCHLCNQIMPADAHRFRVRVTESDEANEYDWLDISLHEKCFRKLAFISLRPLGFDSAEEPEVFVQLSKRERQRIPMTTADDRETKTT